MVGHWVSCFTRSKSLFKCSYRFGQALMRDHTKVVAVGPATSSWLGKSQIQVYSPAAESLLLLSVDDQLLILKCTIG